MQWKSFLWPGRAFRVPQWHWVDKIADHPDVRSITSWVEVVGVLISLWGSLAKGARKDWPKSVETTLGSRTLVWCRWKTAEMQSSWFKVNDNLITLSVAEMKEICVWMFGGLRRENSSAHEKILSQCQIVHHKSHMDWLGSDSGLCGERPANNRLSPLRPVNYLKYFNYFPFVFHKRRIFKNKEQNCPDVLI